MRKLRHGFRVNQAPRLLANLSWPLGGDVRSVIPLLALFTLGAAAQTRQPYDYTSERISQLAYDGWKALVERDGKSYIFDHPVNSAGVACIDWSSFEHTEDTTRFYISHWSAYWEEGSQEESKAKAVSDCEDEKKKERHACTCNIVSEGLKPALKVLQHNDTIRTERVSADLFLGQNATSPTLVLQSGNVTKSGSGSVDLVMLTNDGYQVADHNEHHIRKLSDAAPRGNQPLSEQVVLTHADGTIVAWNKETGREVRVFNKVARILTMSLPVRGPLLLSSNIANLAHLWDIRTGAIIRTFEHAGAAVALSPNG